MSMDLNAYLTSGARWIEAELDRRVPPADTRPATLHAAMRHSLFAGGKRLRPILCAAAATACGAPREAALLPAAAIECLHTYTPVSYTHLDVYKRQVHKRSPDAHWPSRTEINSA